MAAIQPPQPVKLIFGMICADTALLERMPEILGATYGPADVIGEIQPFDFTHYYDEEMGSPLYRGFVAFEHLIDPQRLAEIKIASNELEDRLAGELQRGKETWSAPIPVPPRPINLDPGYIAPSKLILASMKDFSHRVYLRGGVYAEVTLQYRDGWRALPWTFPDYASGRYDAFFTRAREALRRQSRQEASA
ncbi:MAG: DUF4416 family protein [Phycisphaerae bacterium]|nr:DUF4416 family protein [Phycisphaerae bacterium]